MKIALGQMYVRAGLCDDNFTRIEEMVNNAKSEGADILMVKPAMAYLDVIKEVSLNFNCPICAYQVSGEYAMLKMAVEQGIMNEGVIMESLVAIKRAGANMIITYFALEIAERL